MRADRSALHAEPMRLGGGDQALLHQALDAFVSHRPALALGERLFEEFKVGERVHGPDVRRFELILQRFVIELTLKMMHSSLKDRLAVQTAPKSDGAKLLALAQRLMGEVAMDFLRRQINISEDHDAAVVLLQHLRPPAGFLSCIETLAAMKAELLEQRDQPHEMLPR